MMTWLGVGNVQGVLMRADAKKGKVKESLLLRGGVVGSQLPALQATVIPIVKGDTLVFATDRPRRIRSEPQIEFSNSTAAEMTMRSF
jgi:hypothetical protein